MPSMTLERWLAKNANSRERDIVSVLKKGSMEEVRAMDPQSIVCTTASGTITQIKPPKEVAEADEALEGEDAVIADIADDIQLTTEEEEPCQTNSSISTTDSCEEKSEDSSGLTETQPTGDPTK